MIDWAAIIGAIATLLTVIGGALRFLYLKLERRFTDIEAQLEACRRREMAATRINSTQLTVIELLWSEVKRIQPRSNALQRAHKLLEDLKAQTMQGERI